uniref:B30.2/SPRY domain-containing protein n=1 Tax=Globodera rostochiensis TaxID=31243 RepID=A0A914I6M1_GLORO
METQLADQHSKAVEDELEKCREEIMKMHGELKPNWLENGDAEFQKLEAEKNALVTKQAVFGRQQMLNSQTLQKMQVLQTKIVDLENRKLMNDHQTLKKKVMKLEEEQKKMLLRMATSEEANVLMKALLVGELGIGLVPKNCWDPTACHPDLILIESERLIVQHTGTGWGWRSVLAEKSIPSKKIGVFYYEVTILLVKENPVFIGLAPKKMVFDAAVGWFVGTYAYGSRGLILGHEVEGCHQVEGGNEVEGCHQVEGGNEVEGCHQVEGGNEVEGCHQVEGGHEVEGCHEVGGHEVEGCSYDENGRPFINAEYFGVKGDVVGCGINLATRQMFYTKNGRRLDSKLLVTSAEELFPCITLSDFDSKIQANFGPDDFKFKIAELI